MSAADATGAIPPDLLVAVRAAGEWGVLSHLELRACGLSVKGIAVRARKGRLHRIHRGVYAVGHAGVPLEGRFLAAVKACGPGAVLSHYSAAALWALVDWDGRRIQVTVTSQGTRVHRGIRVHRTVRLRRRDRRLRSGIPVTSPARTLLDLASVLPPRLLRRAVRQALAIELVGIRSLLDLVARSKGHPGARRLVRVIGEDAAPTRSELEDVVLDLIDRGGFVRPDVNVPLTLDGRRVIPDFRWPAQRLVIEADGARWHDNPLARRDDAERQALLEAHGERVLRVTWRQATFESRETRVRFQRAGAPLKRRRSSS